MADEVFEVEYKVDTSGVESDAEAAGKLAAQGFQNGFGAVEVKPKVAADTEAVKKSAAESAKVFQEAWAKTKASSPDAVSAAAAAHPAAAAALARRQAGAAPAAEEAKAGEGLAKTAEVITGAIGAMQIAMQGFSNVLRGGGFEAGATAFEKFGDKVTDTAKEAGGLGEKFAAFAPALIGAGAGLLKFGESETEMARQGGESRLELDALAKSSGQTTETFVKMRSLFAGMGVDLNEFGRATANLAIRQQEARADIEKRVAEEPLDTADAQDRVTKSYLAQGAAIDALGSAWDRVTTARGALAAQQVGGREEQAIAAARGPLAVEAAQLGVSGAAVSRGQAGLNVESAQWALDQFRGGRGPTQMEQREHKEAQLEENLAAAQQQAASADLAGRQAELQQREAENQLREQQARLGAVGGPAGAAQLDTNKAMRELTAAIRGVDEAGLGPGAARRGTQRAQLDLSDQARTQISQLSRSVLTGQGPDLGRAPPGLLLPAFTQAGEAFGGGIGGTEQALAQFLQRNPNSPAIPAVFRALYGRLSLEQQARLQEGFTKIGPAPIAEAATRPLTPSEEEAASPEAKERAERIEKADLDYQNKLGEVRRKALLGPAGEAVPALTGAATGAVGALGPTGLSLVQGLSTGVSTGVSGAIILKILQGLTGGAGRAAAGVGAGALGALGTAEVGGEVGAGAGALFAGVGAVPGAALGAVAGLIAGLIAPKLFGGAPAAPPGEQPTPEGVTPVEKLPSPAQPAAAEGGAAGALQGAAGALQGAAGALQSAAGSLQSAAGSLSSASHADAAPAPAPAPAATGGGGDRGAVTATENASGGLISGSGDATSDSISAWLSPHEYVIKAATVQKVGVGFLDRLNSGSFASGGLVREATEAGIALSRSQMEAMTDEDLQVAVNRSRVTSAPLWLLSEFARGTAMDVQTILRGGAMLDRWTLAGLSSAGGVIGRAWHNWLAETVKEAPHAFSLPPEEAKRFEAKEAPRPQVTLRGKPAELVTRGGVTGVLDNGFLVAPDNPRDKIEDRADPEVIKRLAASFAARLQTAQTAGGFAPEGTGYDPRTSPDFPGFMGRRAPTPPTAQVEIQRHGEAGPEPEMATVPAYTADTEAREKEYAKHANVQQLTPGPSTLRPPTAAEQQSINRALVPLPPSFRGTITTTVAVPTDPAERAAFDAAVAAEEARGIHSERTGAETTVQRPYRPGFQRTFFGLEPLTDSQPADQSSPRPAPRAPDVRIGRLAAQQEARGQDRQRFPDLVGDGGTGRGSSRRRRRDDDNYQAYDDPNRLYALGGLIPARVSPGEYLMSGGAVARHGVGFMDRLNAGRFQAGGLAGGAALGYAAGVAGYNSAGAAGPWPAAGGAGLIGSGILAYARDESRAASWGAGLAVTAPHSLPTSTGYSGGAAGQHLLDLSTPGGTFSVTASSDTIEAIRVSAIGSKLTSAGTKPSWY